MAIQFCFLPKLLSVDRIRDLLHSGRVLLYSLSGLQVATGRNTPESSCCPPWPFASMIFFNPFLESSSHVSSRHFPHKLSTVCYCSGADALPRRSARQNKEDRQQRILSLLPVKEASLASKRSATEWQMRSVFLNNTKPVLYKHRLPVQLPFANWGDVISSILKEFRCCLIVL